jgi:ABC-type molybdate transport system substrate-binding protein
MRRDGVGAALLLLLALNVHAQEPVRLFAAGSLRAALDEVVSASGLRVTALYGPSGLLRDRIAKGEAADVFASANMEHPRSLEQSGRAGAVRLFARNQLCALAAPHVNVDRESLLERLLDPALKLGTSTPRADPSGDYAFQLFAKAESLKAGARAALEKKALQLTGGPDSPPPPKDRNAYGALVAEGKADIFLTYCTNALQARQENPRLRIAQVPAALAVGADYGLTVLKGAPSQAERMVQFVLSPAGQFILAKHGFATGGSP